jgi:hypothetical protein
MDGGGDHFITVFRDRDLVKIAQSWQGKFTLATWVEKTGFSPMNLKEFGNGLQ